MTRFNPDFNKKFWEDPSKFVSYVDPETVKYKVNTSLVIRNKEADCYRENQVYFNQMAPLYEQNVDFPYADFIVYANPTARFHDFSQVILDDIDNIVKRMKKGAEIIVVSKAANIESEVREKYKDVKFSFMYDHFVEALGKKFELNMKDQYLTYDFEKTGKFFAPQTNIWPVNGCMHKCGFCRRCYMHIPFESLPLDLIKKKLDYAKLHYPEVLHNVSLRAENLTEYGIDIYGEQKLDELIRLLGTYEEISNIEIPIGLHIGEVNDKILDAICECDKIRSIVVSVEVGTDKLFKLINKGNTRDNTLYVCKKIREAHPDIFMSALTMVGLPTETEEDIVSLASLLKECGFNGSTCNFYATDPKQPLYKLPQLTEEQQMDHTTLLFNTLKNNHTSEKPFHFYFEISKKYPMGDYIEQLSAEEVWFVGNGYYLSVSKEDNDELLKNTELDKDKETVMSVLSDGVQKEAKRQFEQIAKAEAENPGEQGQNPKNKFRGDE